MACHSHRRAQQRRLALARLHRLRFFGHLDRALDRNDNLPRLRTQRVSRPIPLSAALALQGKLPGTTVERNRGSFPWPPKPAREKLHVVVRRTREGAPFRTPSLNWALEDQITQRWTTDHLKHVQRHGRYNGLHVNSPVFFKRFFRKQFREEGKIQCRAALHGDDAAFERVSPDGRRGSLAWVID